MHTAVHMQCVIMTAYKFFVFYFYGIINACVRRKKSQENSSLPNNLKRHV